MPASAKETRYGAETKLHLAQFIRKGAVPLNKPRYMKAALFLIIFLLLLVTACDKQNTSEPVAIKKDTAVFKPYTDTYSGHIEAIADAGGVSPFCTSSYDGNLFMTHLGNGQLSISVPYNLCNMVMPSSMLIDSPTATKNRAFNDRYAIWKDSIYYSKDTVYPRGCAEIWSVAFGERSVEVGRDVLFVMLAMAHFEGR